MTQFQQALSVVAPYFEDGTEAEKFLARQCQHHLNIAPAQLSPHDLWNLANWVTMSGSLVVGKEKAEQMGEKIRELRKKMGQIALREL